ncbi:MULTISPECIES: alpha-glucosidase [unclassified Oceanispirochaeta]|uniref:glycoside hydrolase family 13 protein n=1 Tax=unclassified Oceanispirochaeta TaxID=2635722 RepID=UPI000E090A5B|nr:MULTISPECIES: alpha-glucosidase [unclassified Oceanispirochaeta]MBF9016927.1 alpha-glucosidase [Oceanispirochaeta sp. M2]NPD73290.1 alpha-glucosidase [Oceanispirochaeta sp. M1]RDG30954.1 alpha-glucosidase [Oceanispirochaeta sp. M1]
MFHHKPLEELVVYQIYTRSFKDSNGDGIGDLAGVTQKLDYLADLGVDMLWLSPFCSSPNDDMGYDISDYQNIMTEMGTMEDLDNLLEEAHKRNIGIMMDLVLNHSSDEHSWFIESRSSKDNPKRDWYIWADKPNNWDSYFCPEAWEYDEVTGQYYLHIFGVKQPDLNWRNEELRAEIHRMVDWWLEKGIDGIRFDAIHLIGKPEGNPDYVHAPGESKRFCHFRNHELGHHYLQEMHDKVMKKHDPVTVGETGGSTPEGARLYVDKKRNEFDMIFHLGFLEDDEFEDNPAQNYKKFYEKWYKQLSIEGWDATYLGNHDLARAVSVIGDEENYWRESATCLATMIMTQWGTPYIYQGDEIGMVNAGFTSLDQFRDPHTTIRYHAAEEKGDDSDAVLKEIIKWGRDNSRTPMQWDASPNGGFSDAEPWIMMARNWEHINVAAQENKRGTIFNYYKKMIALRKSNKNLAYGKMEMVKSEPAVFAYNRIHEGRTVQVVLNLSSSPSAHRIDDFNDDQVLISNYPSQRKNVSGLMLRPWEAVVIS